jgi:CubicO group peptidase (beta-lactamase class C family)
MFRLIYFLILIIFFMSCKKYTIPSQGINLPTPSSLPSFKRNYWPTDSWKTSTPEEQGMSSEKLNQLTEYLFPNNFDEKDKTGIRTDSVLIIKNGYIVYEKYGRGYSDSSPHLLWSISKSITNALVGIAIEKKIIQKTDQVSKYFNFIPSDDHKKIQIHHLLNMSSGLKSEEDYETGPLRSTVIAMLYTRGKNDMGEFSFKLPIRSEPGTFVYYSSCDTNILTYILKKSMEPKNYNSFPWVELFNQIGMKNITFEQDSSGTFVGSSYIYATPRDTAKFAYLFLNNGNWNGKKILSEEWITYSRTPSPAYTTTVNYKSAEEFQYTALWYSNFPIPEKKISQPWPDAPIDTFAALGHWGQSIFIIPSLDLIVVRTADDRDKTFSKNEYLKKIIDSIPLVNK